VGKITNGLLTVANPFPVNYVHYNNEQNCGYQDGQLDCDSDAVLKVNIVEKKAGSLLGLEKTVL
jgi:hypothetical protein